MRIVVDAMGSDKAPGPEVEGAVAASLVADVEVILVGDEAILRPALEQFPQRGAISIEHAAQHISMGDLPMVAVRQKKDNSLLVGLRLVKAGKADGFVSAGNTGAVMLSARVVLGPIFGVARSAICQVLPTARKPVVVLDLGANVNCTADQLCEFAEMGQVFSRLTLDVAQPRVGLLSIGEEEGKGTEITRKVNRNLTTAAHINFIGNVEPKAIFEGKADVVVCDGFTGNVFLKTSEAVALLIKTLTGRHIRSTLISAVGGLLSSGALRRLKKTTDPNEQPGAPLLGVDGIVIIQHGSATALGIKNAILGARREMDLGLVEHIRKGIEDLRAAIPPGGNGR